MKAALQQALEALIAIRTQYESLLDSDYATRSNPDPASREPSIAQATAAIAACRAALAQPDDARALAVLDVVEAAREFVPMLCDFTLAMGLMNGGSSEQQAQKTADALRSALKALEAV